MIFRLIDAFQKFLINNPKSMLVMHCLPRDQTGWDLPQILRDRGLLNNVVFTDKASKGVGDIHVPESDMRKLYCTMDVHALSTGGEGFGVPIVEAMACGIPNVVTDYCTTKEFLTEQSVGDDGNPVFTNVRGISVPINEVEVHHTGGIWAKVNTGAMAKAFQYLKDNDGEAKQMGMKARKFAVETYDNELVKEQWKELYRNYDSFVETNRAKMQTAGLKLIKVT